MIADITIASESGVWILAPAIVLMLMLASAGFGFWLRGYIVRKARQERAREVAPFRAPRRP